MKKRNRKALAALLAVCILLGLLPMAALALDETVHDHTGWTAVTMGENFIKLGEEEQTANTLPAGSYYLDADLTAALTVTGEVNLCLNGHSVTVSSGHAVTVSSGASLTLWDCAADSTGKLAYTGTDTSYYGIYNQGTLTLNSGTVESAFWGVCNYSNSTFTMTGGSVTGKDASSGYGVYNYSSSSVFKLSGGSVSGGQYGIYNKSSGSQVYLSGSPSISGGTADIYTNSYSSKIYADDGGSENAVPYSGQTISLRYSSGSNGNTIVYHVTEDTKDKFTLVGSIGDNFELKFSEEDNTLQFQGKPQTLTWYDINGDTLTGDGYPTTWPYYSYFPDDDSDMPAAPPVEGKLFLGWLYKKADASDWGTDYWSDRPIYNATAFKADYIDDFPGGSGTESDPYQLATATDLQKLSTLVSKDITAYNNSGVYYLLTDNIDLSTVCGEELGSWTPIGNLGFFRANFDGNNKTISNLYINTSASYQGLFGGLEYATVKSLTITGSVTAGEGSGALAGWIADSTVENVDVTGVTLTPYGYTPDGNRTMAHKIDGTGNTTIHVQGNYKNNWIQTTYNREGYHVEKDNLDGAAVAASADFINGGKYVQLSYTVTAGETAITDGKLAVHADIQIGDNDSAAVEVIQDADGQVIGLKMVDTHTVEAEPGCISSDAQFNLYFDGTGGVTPVDTYWFGRYTDRTDPDPTYGKICFAPLKESTKSNATYEQNADGVYTKLSGVDSGFAVSWQNISLDPGQSKTYSFILGVGEKADPPQWDEEKAVTLTLVADAEQNNRLVNVSAKVKDAAGLTDTLYYSVDGGDGEVLGSVEADGATMKAITGQLDLSDYPNGTYLFSFWVVNSKGAASASVEREITISADGIEGLDGVEEPEHTHAWAEAWSSNDTHHWHECTADGCDVTDNSGKDGYAAHSGGTASCTAKAVCGTCGQSYGSLAAHDFTGDYLSDADGHWHKCANCDATDTKTAHVYDNDADATCNTCGYTRTVTPPEQDGADISGTVTDNGAPVADAAVNLVKGREVIQETTTDENGAYTFTNVASGDYNVVASKDGKTMTILVKVETTDLTEQNLAMPADSVNSVLDVKENTPAVVVGGLEAEAASHSEVGKTITVTMTVESKEETDEDAAADIVKIKEKASGKTLTILAVTVEKQVDEEEAQPISETSQLMTIIIPFDKTGKKNITVYRCHGDTAEALPTAANADGEYFVVGSNDVTVYAKKFSTYAIGYTAETTTPSRPVIVIKPEETKPVWPFVDVTEADWFYGSVKYVYQQGLMEGTDATHFAPGLTTSRAMIATIIWRLAGSPETEAELTYSDCVKDSWYAAAVAWGTEHGVVKGFSRDVFAPDDPITREQLAAMLWRYAGKPTASGTLDRFSDSDKAGSWAVDALRWAVEQSILRGKGSGLLDPTGLSTRAETAAVLERFCESGK